MKESLVSLSVSLSSCLVRFPRAASSTLQPDGERLAACLVGDQEDSIQEGRSWMLLCEWRALRLLTWSRLRCPSVHREGWSWGLAGGVGLDSLSPEKSPSYAGWRRNVGILLLFKHLPTILTSNSFFSPTSRALW